MISKHPMPTNLQYTYRVEMLNDNDHMNEISRQSQRLTSHILATQKISVSQSGCPLLSSFPKTWQTKLTVRPFYLWYPGIHCRAAWDMWKGKSVERQDLWKGDRTNLLQLGAKTRCRDPGGFSLQKSYAACMPNLQLKKWNLEYYK